MERPRMGLLAKFGIIFLVFTVVTLATSSVATYMNQSDTYQAQQERQLEEIADYLASILQRDGSDFLMYQEYFLRHHDEIEVPRDFTDDDVQTFKATFEHLFAKSYPGMVLGKDVSVEDLSRDVLKAYGTWRHAHYLSLFEAAQRRFGIAYAYYIVPTGEYLHMCYVFDAVREANEADESLIELGIDVLEPIERHEKMWEAWNTGKVPSGYDTFDNEYGKTYAWYAPLHVGRQKLGVIGVEVEIASYNKTIFSNTMRQLGSIAAILVVMVGLTLWFIDRVYISKIRSLADAVGDYARNKDVAVASVIEQPGHDELCALSNQTAATILELDNYMKSLVETTEELSQTRDRVGVESRLARTDALTGVANRNAYEEEVQRLSLELAQGETEFGFAVADVNFLKQVNDTLGHESGNARIRECCSALRDAFPHSQVYRIGGDEFAVILRGEDYRHADKCVEQFNEAQAKDAEEPWQRFSAAIGHALYDPSCDSCVENVFSRADKRMYRRKREMKALR